ncbi:MAG: hypothetical protein MK197_04985 [Candidatus Poseidoniaceae archaeon]|nr:hypothetical protein [Candidatus Poseidoniaceae archaeon]
MSKMRRDMNSDNASQGISAMIIFVSIILMCSIISAVVIGFGEKVFAETKTDAQENIPSFKGIVNIVVFEISSLGADDELHLVFELPYIEQSIGDTNVAWVVMCFPTNQGGGRQTMHFDEGDFSLATELDGDGLTAADIDEFEPAVTYRMIMQLSECDLEAVDEASLVIMVDRGRTQEWQMNIGSAPYQGQDLN